MISRRHDNHARAKPGLEACIQVLTTVDSLIQWEVRCFAPRNVVDKDRHTHILRINIHNRDFVGLGMIHGVLDGNHVAFRSEDKLIETPWLEDCRWFRTLDIFALDLAIQNGGSTWAGTTSGERGHPRHER